MARWFNVAGPCKPEIHYMLPALRRLPTVRRLIDQMTYFVMHAPRQVGKTTALLALAEELLREGRHVAVVVSSEVGAPLSRDLEAAEPAILDAWRGAAERRLPRDLWPPPWPEAAPGRRIGAALQAWASAAPRPLVVLIDEIDALEDVTLVSALRQIRDGYPDRPRSFQTRSTARSSCASSRPPRARRYPGSRRPGSRRRGGSTPSGCSRHSWRSGGSTARPSWGRRRTTRSRRTWC